jgi:hypothetical protein
MERAKVVRGLRIAWSVWWGILCVLLVVLWVRSYWALDFIRTRPIGTRQLYAMSGRGIVAIGSNDDPYGPQWEHTSYANAWIAPREEIPLHGFGYWRVPGGLLTSGPYWFLVLLSGTVAAFPWICFSLRRFSLRSFLIATTLIAVVLGLAVWLVR